MEPNATGTNAKYCNRATATTVITEYGEYTVAVFSVIDVRTVIRAVAVFADSVVKAVRAVNTM